MENAGIIALRQTNGSYLYIGIQEDVSLIELGETLMSRYRKKGPVEELIKGGDLISIHSRPKRGNDKARKSPDLETLIKTTKNADYLYFFSCGVWYYRRDGEIKFLHSMRSS